MICPPKPENEEARLAALHRYGILDLPIQEEFEEVTRLIANICQTPIAVINLIDRDRQWFVSEIGLGTRETPLDISICAHAILQPDLFIVPDTHEDERFAHNPLVTGDPHLRFYAGALLETEDGHALGTLCVLDYKTRELTEEQKNILQVLAHQVMKQIELRRLVQQKQRVVETLQRSLLIDVSNAAIPGLEVEPLYAAAWSEADIGGDFYDIFPLDEHHVALVVGDVSGKGLAAAARTAEVKYALRAFFQEDRDPAQTLARLNNFLCQFHDYAAETSPRFVVAALGMIDTRTGETKFSLAGAEAPLVRRSSGEIEMKSGVGMPLGIQSGELYQNISWQLGSGDILLLVTDGVTEARQGSSYLNLDGLVQLFSSQPRAKALRTMGDGILEGAKTFAGGKLSDDACLILARLP